MPSHDEYMQSIERSLRNAFMIPDEVSLTPEDIRSIRKSTLIDYWSAPKGKRLGTDFVLHCSTPMSFSRHEAQVETFRRLYSDIKVPWFTGEFTREQKKDMGWPVEEKLARGLNEHFVHIDAASFKADDIHNYGDHSPVIPQKNGTVLMTGGRRTGLTMATLAHAKALMNQADMVMMETDRDTGLSEMKVITHKESSDMVDYIESWKNPLDKHPSKGMKNKFYPSQMKRAAKRKAQKTARRIQRKAK